MEFNKRTILWVVFSVSLVLLWNQWMISKGKQSMFSSAPPAATVPVTQGAPATAGVPQAPGAAAPAAPVAAPAAPQSQKVTVATDVVKADIDTLGGVITRLELLKFRDEFNPGKNQVLFDVNPAAGRVYVAQTGLAKAGNLSLPDHLTLFTLKPGSLVPDANGRVQVVLEAEQNSVRLTKTYTFKNGDYVIDLRHDVANVGTAPVQPAIYLQFEHDGNKPEGSSFFNPRYTGPQVYSSEGHYQKLTFEGIEKGKEDHVTQATDGWIALSQHFFVSALLPQEKLQRTVYTNKVRPNVYTVGNVIPLGTLAPGATVSNTARLYSGPMDEKKLETIAPELDRVKDYGKLTIIAKPIFWVMGLLHSAIGNWGWTIIAFTVLIKLVFFPLSAAGYKSMAKIKLVTPKLQAIRERHKDDPAKMNQATMELYKSEKINPLGGCLPILVQMPVFIALYWVLQASVEMRGAPWVGWITDLTKPDPWFILPVIYAISMFVSTRLNPQPADPMQAKMMMWMPLVFSVMFFFFPSGLVLYWVVNNLLSIAQQWVITKKFETAK